MYDKKKKERSLFKRSAQRNSLHLLSILKQHTVSTKWEKAERALKLIKAQCQSSSAVSSSCPLESRKGLPCQMKDAGCLSGYSPRLREAHRAQPVCSHWQPKCSDHQ